MQSRINNACKEHDLPRIKTLINKDNVNQTDCWGRTPIYYSVRYGAIDIFYFLVSLGADLYKTYIINKQEYDLIDTALNTNGNSVENYQIIAAVLSVWLGPLYISRYISKIFCGSACVLQLFIQHIPNISLKGYERQFCSKAQEEHYRVLLKYHICFCLQQAMRYTIVYRKRRSFMFLLSQIKCSEQLDYIYTTSGRSTLNLVTLCATRGYYNELKILLREGADPKLLTVNGMDETMTPLHAICDNWFTERELVNIKRCLHLLLKYIDVNQANTKGQTALMFANRKSNDEIIMMLKEYGADPTAVDMCGRKALTYVKYRAS